MSKRLARRQALAALGLGAICATAAAGCGASHGALPSRSRSAPQRSSGTDATSRRSLLLGHSVDGRPIHATEVGDLDNPRSVLVIGDIHGNESAGIPVARRLASARPRPESLTYVIKDLNPDGVAAGTRQNARGVDLNRNLPYRWRQLGAPGDLQYSGPQPLSEPEARIAHSLILRVRPAVTIWFHQPLGLVDKSGGSVSVERQFSRLVGLPLRRLRRYPGSAAGWQNHRLPGTTAFVVELPAGQLSGASISRYTAAIRTLTRS